MLRNTALILAFTLAAAAPGAAQERGPKNDKIPAGMQPPPGMCRIWLDGVPPGQQPAPTDCTTAVRNRPPNGRVIFGDDYVERGKQGDDKRKEKPKKPHDDDQRRR